MSARVLPEFVPCLDEGSHAVTSRRSSASSRPLQPSVREAILKFPYGEAEQDKPMRNPKNLGLGLGLGLGRCHR